VQHHDVPHGRQTSRQLLKPARSKGQGQIAPYGAPSDLKKNKTTYSEGREGEGGLPTDRVDIKGNGQVEQGVVRRVPNPDRKTSLPKGGGHHGGCDIKVSKEDGYDEQRIYFQGFLGGLFGGMGQGE